MTSLIEENQSRGLTPPPEVIVDGEIHRFASNGSASDTARWYVVWQLSDELQTGAFGCWRNGISETWASQQINRIRNPAKRSEVQKLQKQAIEQARQKKEESQREAEKLAQAYWTQGSPLILIF